MANFISLLSDPETFLDALLARRNAPPRNPFEAAAGFIYVLARQLLQREIRDERRRIAIIGDFEAASERLVRAAMAGTTAQEQFAAVREFWENAGLPPSDLRKRRSPAGPPDQQLQLEVKDLGISLRPILRDRKNKPVKDVKRAISKLASWATPKAIRDAASEAPMTAACILVGNRYPLGADTVRNRVSRAKKTT